jgi:uncharacterized protein
LLLHAACRPLADVLPILLLVCSNVFMTLASYGHLNFKGQPVLLMTLAS